MKRTPYTDTIRAALARLGLIGVDPMQVEAWMRMEYKTLDHLTPEQFTSEVALTADLARRFPTESADLAASYGLNS